MANTPLMGINLPTPTVTDGPEWAEEVNAGFETVDSHDHSSGKGTPITPSGLSINADLPLGENNLTNARSYRVVDNLAALGDAADLRCLYAANGELYYNDTVGNQVQITASGGLNAASIGGIGGDYASSTALLSYNNTSKTFLFEQNTGIKALIDCADITIREAASLAEGIKIKSPVGLSSSYDITLPTALPAEQRIMTMNASGELAAAYVLDETSVEVSSGEVQIKDSGVTTAKINDLAVTEAKLATDAVTTAKIEDLAVTREKQEAVGQQISSATSVFSATGTGEFAVTNLSVSITTSGRPVVLILTAKEDALPNSGNYIRATSVGSGVDFNYGFKRDAVRISASRVRTGGTSTSEYFLPGGFFALDTPAAGTYTYTFNVYLQSSDYSFSCNGIKLVAYEL